MAMPGNCLFVGDGLVSFALLLFCSFALLLFCSFDPLFFWPFGPPCILPDLFSMNGFSFLPIKKKTILF